MVHRRYALREALARRSDLRVTYMPAPFGSETPEPLNAAVFGISIYSDEGVHVTSPDSPPIQGLPLPGETGTVYLVFDKLRLRAGKYDFTVAAQPPQTSEYRPYDHYYRAYALSVVGPSPDGLVVLPHRWEESAILSDVEDDHLDQEGG